MRRQSLRNVAVAVVAMGLLAVMATPGQADRGVGYYVPSLLLPGYGQSKDGHYSKAAVFAGVSVAGWIGLFATQINYNRSVDQFDLAVAQQQQFSDDLAAGVPVLSSDIDMNYVQILESSDTADRRYTQRNVFAGALFLVYAINALDIILSEPDTGEMPSDEEPAVMLDVTPDRVMVVKTFRF